MNKEWQMMARHMDKLRGQLEESRRWCVTFFTLFVITAMGMTYVLIQGGV